MSSVAVDIFVAAAQSLHNTVYPFHICLHELEVVPHQTTIFYATRNVAPRDDKVLRKKIFNSSSSTSLDFTNQQLSSSAPQTHPSFRRVFLNQYQPHSFNVTTKFSKPKHYTFFTLNIYQIQLNSTNNSARSRSLPHTRLARNSCHYLHFSNTIPVTQRYSC